MLSSLVARAYKSNALIEKCTLCAGNSMWHNYFFARAQYYEPTNDDIICWHICSSKHRPRARIQIAYCFCDCTTHPMHRADADGERCQQPPAAHLLHPHTYEGDSCVTYKCFSPFRGLHNIFKCARVAVCFIDVVILAGAVWPRARRVF